MRSITVITRPPELLFQDLGRAGLSYIGVSESGACDRGAYLLANRLVGNGKNATALEILLGPAEFEVNQYTIFAVTGTNAVVTVQSRPAPSNCAVVTNPGERIRIESPTLGIRTYFAVDGGFNVDQVLGSSSFDTLSSIGPRTPVEGRRIGLGTADRSETPYLSAAPVRDRLDPIRLTGWLGPRAVLFEPASISKMAHSPLTVTANANRVGIRLVGAELRRLKENEMSPEGVLRGCIQATPAGELIVFLSDHPVTGGYPTIGILDDRSCDICAQLRPGDRLWVTLRR